MTRRAQVGLLLVVALLLVAGLCVLGLYGVASSRGPLPPPAFTEADLPPRTSGASPWEHGSWASYGAEPVVEEPPRPPGRRHRRRHVRTSAVELIPPIDASTRQALRDSVGAQNIAQHAEEFAQALGQPLALDGMVQRFFQWTHNVLIAASRRYDAGEEAFALSLLESLFDREVELARNNRGEHVELATVITSISETLAMMHAIGDARGGVPLRVRQRVQALMDHPLDLSAPYIAFFLDVRAEFERGTAQARASDLVTFDPEESGRLLNEHATHCVAFIRDRSYVIPPMPPRSWRRRLFNADGDTLVRAFAMEDAEPFSRCGGVETLRTRDDAMRVVATDILAMPVRE